MPAQPVEIASGVLARTPVAWFQSSPVSGRSVIDTTTNRSVRDVVECLTVKVRRHSASFDTTPPPQGEMRYFGDSNVIKVHIPLPGSTMRKRDAAHALLRNVTACSKTTHFQDPF
ncbi:hypothetical protein [Paraburkholderia adhaesiva]|uniref:hypothetical protein n=1 Tax=Paraburkholderia adhaesiva TaxID=2883244 RepID=UPI001F23A733|nr:hypothetical protein [Paraburkholderia adhaesiva]